MRGLLAVYRCRCDHAAATLLLLLSRSMSWVVMGLLKFPLMKIQPLRGVGGCGACGRGKGRNGGKRGETVFWCDTKSVVVVGRGQRGGVGGYLILWVWGLWERTDGGKRDETVFSWGDTKPVPVVVCGAAVGERGWTE
eukprot:scaffold57078_cov53-Attheya_sp.AAC.1